MRRIPFCILLGCLLIVLGPTPGNSQFQLPGGSSGGSRGAGMLGDPSKLFDMMSGGKDVATRDTLPSPWLASMFDRFAQQVGATDGRITREQFNAAMAAKASGATPGTAAPSGAPGGSPGAGPPAWGKGGGDRKSEDSADMLDRMADSMFRRYDTNGDGLLNYDEMSESLRIERDKFDTNKDGFIDLAEFKNYVKAAMQQRMAEGRDTQQATPATTGDPDEDEPKPTVFRAGKLPKDIPNWFKPADTDGDGQLTMLEWRTAGRSLDEFARLDRNGDGFITIAEVMFSVQGKYNYNGVAVATNHDKPAADAKTERGGGSGSDKAAAFGNMLKGMGGMGGTGGFGKGGTPADTTKGADTKGGDTSKSGRPAFGKTR